MPRETRTWSVYPVWIKGEPAAEYAKVATGHAGMRVGSEVDVQRQAATTIWQRARVVDRHVSTLPPGQSAAAIIWLELLP